MLQFTPFHSVIHSILGEGAASWGVLFEHKKLVELAEKSDIANQAAEAAKLAAEVAASTVVSHSHDSSHAHTECTDPTHDHGHDAATCTDPTHDHGHDAATCTDPTHDHGHDAADRKSVV